MKTLKIVPSLLISLLVLGLQTANANPVNTLNKLIETAKDGQEGFRVASENVKDPKIKLLFASYSTQRGKFVEKLQKTVVELGGKAEQKDTVTGDIHQALINLKAAVTRGDERAMLAEAEKGEAVAVRVFEDAAKEEDLPLPVRKVVQKMAEQVRKTYENVKNLEDKAKVDNMEEWKDDWNDKKDDMHDKIEDLKD